MCSNGDFAVVKYTFDYKIIAKANISYIFVQYRNIEGMFMITLTGVVFRSISHTLTKHNDLITRSFRKLTKYYNYERIIRLFVQLMKSYCISRYLKHGCNVVISESLAFMFVIALNNIEWSMLV